MNFRNIFVVVDVDNIQPQPNAAAPGTFENPITISNADDCITMLDDLNDLHASQGSSELITQASCGDLCIWSLLTKNPNSAYDVSFAKIEAAISNNYSIFNWCSTVQYSAENPISQPIVSNEGKKCMANISDELMPATYKYDIIFKVTLKGDQSKVFYYILDPFVHSKPPTK